MAYFNWLEVVIFLKCKRPTFYLTVQSQCPVPTRSYAETRA
jgi:hypothetical protein